MSNESEVGPTVISQFLCEQYITILCPTTDGNAWLCNIDTNTVNLTNNKGETIQSISHSVNIRDISLDPTTGRMWFCCWEPDGSILEVQSMSPPYTPTTRFTIERYPYSLCVTREGQILVGTWGKQGFQLVMYETDGQVLASTEVKASGTGAVHSITECGVTGSIATVSSGHTSGNKSDISDFMYDRLIIVYNKTLQPLVQYRGEGIEAREAVKPEEFAPITVAYDSKGNILISDVLRSTVELISGTGKYIRTLYTNKKGQREIGLQNGDVLWSRVVFDERNLQLLWGIKLIKYYNDK